MPDRWDRITVHSPGNSVAVASWIEQLCLADRVRAEAAWPVFEAEEERPDAVIIANRAGDHFAAAASALRAGIPALVEKPVCLARGQIEDLCEISRANRTVFGASNVFLFARYFETYAAAVAKLGKLHGLRFVWTDGAYDIRRGETKSYDSAVTVFDDVLPHIVPMIGQLEFRGLSLVSLDVQDGGAKLEVKARSEGRSISLIIARNQAGRQRRIDVATETASAVLDFSNEPGIIDVSGVHENGDPLWNDAPGPLATMLAAFIAAAAGQAPDPRLSPCHAISAASLVDGIRRPYFEYQAGWLERRLGEPLDVSLQYALAELSSDAERVAVAAAWPSMDSSARLRSFLAKSPLRPNAGYDR
jgi:predicted dehydrogenase